MFTFKRRTLWLAMALAVSAAPAWAEKPDWAGKGKSGRPDKSNAEQGRQGGADSGRAGFKFDERQRTAVSGYFGTRVSSGHCPPGLAKKNNGCQPPGQAKKWKLGQPLPGDVVFYELPRQVLVDLGPPPPRHRFVRVAADILLIAIGTGMVIDAIEDLGRM